MPIARVHLSFSMLHPLYDALGFTWERGRACGSRVFARSRAEASDRFLRSPYYHLLNNKLDHLRRRIDYSGPSEFPVFEDLKALGITDYMAFRHMFSAGKEQGMMGSWSTDSPSGFSESMIAALLRIQNHLAVAAKMAVLNRLADNMLTTYLGNDAGKRVLNGNIRRGQGDTIRAALVMADMRGSTMLAEQEGREAYIETLNQFFDAIAAPFNRQRRPDPELPRRRLHRRLSLRPASRALGDRLQGGARRGAQGYGQDERAQREQAAQRPFRNRLRHRAACRKRHVRQCRTE